MWLIRLGPVPPRMQDAPEGNHMYSCLIPTKSFSRLYVPRDREPLRRYFVVVPISDIPSELEGWLEVNARDSSNKGRVPNAIRQTLNEKPEWFAEYNRGLTVVASSIEFDNKDNILRLEFKDRNYHGVLDGGHTLRAILDDRRESDEVEQAGFCNMEILTGLDESEIPNVVEARNTSKQVALKSLQNLEGTFDDLKAALGGKAELITWKENEEGEFDVREVIAILTALDAGSFGDNNHPIFAYTAKERCLKRFADNKAAYEKLYGIASDALDVWEQIQHLLPGQYNEESSGRFGGLTGVKYNHKRPKKLPFTGLTTEYNIPTGYLYPILSSLRAFLVEKDGEWAWGSGIDPIDLVVGGFAARVFVRSVRESIDNYRNPNRTGKDAQAWTAAYQAARIEYLEMRV